MVTKSKAKSGFLELVKTVVYALLLAGVIRTLFFQPFWIPSGSMKPTLLIGDFLFVNKMAYGYSRHSCPFSICPFDGRILAREPQRGDVVVFKHPTNGTDYIKRLIGLPGDTVQVIDGMLYINGEPVPQEPDGTFIEVNEPQGPMRSMPRCMNRPVGPGGDCTPSRRSRRCPEGGGTWSSTSRTGSATPRRCSPCPRASTSSWATTATTRWTGASRVGRRRRLRAVREPHRPRRPGDVLLGRAVDAGLLDLAARPLLQGDRVKLGRAMAAAAARLGHDFARPELLVEALTHPSIATGPHNQRLEFLGDRVLGLVIAEALLAAGPGADEGELAPRLNALVRKETCAEVAAELDLGPRCGSAAPRC